MTISQTALEWIDFAWVPVALFALRGSQKWQGALFVAAGGLMLRLQAEMMETLGYPTGFLPFLASDVLYRGMIVYSALYVVYFALAFWSPGSRHSVFLAFTLSFFFFCLFVSSLAMVL